MPREETEQERQLRQELAEFKQWLEENPEKKRLAKNWEEFLGLFEGDHPSNVLRFGFIFYEGGMEAIGGFCQALPGWRNNRAVVLEWKINVKDKGIIKEQQRTIAIKERELQHLNNNFNLEINKVREWKEKYERLITQRKTQITHELNLIREALHD